MAILKTPAARKRKSVQPPGAAMAAPQDASRRRAGTRPQEPFDAPADDWSDVDGADRWLLDHAAYGVRLDEDSG